MIRRPVILLIRSLQVGGAERQVVELARSLKRSGTPVEVVTFYGGGQLESDLLHEGVPYHALGKRGRFEIAGFGLRLLRVLRARRPEVVYGFLATSNILLALLKPLLRGAPVIWGVRASNVNLGDYDRLTRLSYRVEAALSRRADLIVANSHAGRQQAVLRGFPPERIIVIPNGIDTQRFRFDAEGRRRIRAEFGINNDERVIGLVARFDPMKDHATFVRAAGILAARVPQVRFMCVGNGSDADRSRLRALGESLGVACRFIWSGARTDMPAVYSAFEIGCSSSAHGEGFSNAVAEAMACERACVVTDVGDSAFIVDGVGEVVPCGDPAALASGIERLLAADRAVIGGKARRRIVENFDAPELVRRTLAALAQARHRSAVQEQSG